jgi:hypothetical protein
VTRETLSISEGDRVAVCWTFGPGGYHIPTRPGDPLVYDVQVAIVTPKTVIPIQFSARAVAKIRPPADDMAAS